MTFTSLGRVNQPAPGTPIRISTDPTARVARLFFQVVPGLTGKAYIGTPAMNKTTLSAVARVLAPNPVGGIADQFEVSSESGQDLINLTEYVFDMDVAGEGLLISYWTE